MAQQIELYENDKGVMTIVLGDGRAAYQAEVNTRVGRSTFSPLMPK